MIEGHDEDARRMLEVQRGDFAAFEVLVDRYRQPLFQFIQRTILDPDETEDLAQQVFVQVWKAAGRYRPTSKFSTWLFTIARNLCLNELRRRGRHPAESLDRLSESGDGVAGHEPEDRRDPGVAGEALLTELAGKIDEALAGLPETQRTAILLLREREMDYDEIAKVLGVSVSATKSIIHRGRETLKRRLKPYLRSGAWEESPSREETFPPTRV